MKHFKIIGPKTTREFDIEDDEMLIWNIYNIEEYAEFCEPFKKKSQNEKIYTTESQS